MCFEIKRLHIPPRSLYPLVGCFAHMAYICSTIYLPQMHNRSSDYALARIVRIDRIIKIIVKMNYGLSRFKKNNTIRGWLVVLGNDLQSTKV